MSSRHPKDGGRSLVSPRIAAPVERETFSLPVWTASSTVVAASSFVCDRPQVLKEIWVALSAVPAAAGTFNLSVTVVTAAGVTSNVIVNAANMLTLVTSANTAFKLTFAAETSANELTLKKGDVITFTQIASSTISTNATANVVVIFQTLSNK